MTTHDVAYYLALSYPYELTKEEDGFFATHPDLPGCMAEGDTADEAIRNLDASREIWIETRITNGYDVPEPRNDEFSGRVSLRMASSLHCQLAKIAQRESMSLNSLMNYALASFVGASESMRWVKDVSTVVTELSENIKYIKSIAIPPIASNPIATHSPFKKLEYTDYAEYTGTTSFNPMGVLGTSTKE